MLCRFAGLLLAAWAAQPASGGLLVSAAVSLSEALDQTAGAYREAGGAEIKLNLAGSNVLARQILNGAPVDVFVSADHAQMDRVTAAGLVLAGTQRAIASNQLVVVAASERAAAVGDAFASAGPAIRRLAIGDPAAVPAGVYARRYLERRGLWVAFAGRIVPAANVRAALAAVQAGGAEAAIVYRTDVHPGRGLAVAFAIPAGETPDIAYHAAVMAGSPQPVEARRFVSFLAGPRGQAILAAHGFLPPRPAPVER